MFGIPKSGWVEIDVEGYRDSASYICSVAEQVLERCHSFLNGSGQFYLEFDAEGSNFGIVMLNDELYYWTNKMSNRMVVFPIFENLLAEEGVKKIAQEMINAVCNNTHEWVNFEAINYEEDENETAKKLEELSNAVLENLKSPYMNMELGNLMFGNSRGNFPVNRDWQDTFCEFLAELGFDSYGHIDDDKLEEHLQTVYGDVTKEVDGEEFTEHVHYFDNGTFSVMPYFWGDSENIAALPNFVFHPANFQIQWYKYPLRDSYCNKVITFEEFKDMLDKCRKSMNK